MLSPNLQVRQKVLEEQHSRLAADRRALEDERKGIAEERAALGEDRLRTSRAAEAVRAMQLRLSGHLSGGGTPLSDVEFNGLEKLIGGDTVGAGRGTDLGAGSLGTMEMLRKILQDVRADGRGSGSAGDKHSKKLSSGMKLLTNKYSAATAGQLEFLASLRGSSSHPGATAKTWQRAGKVEDAEVSRIPQRHSNVSNASSAPFMNLTSVSASGNVNSCDTSENDSSDLGEPVL